LESILALGKLKVQLAQPITEGDKTGFTCDHMESDNNFCCKASVDVKVSHDFCAALVI
jgi:hypothetical protein